MTRDFIAARLRFTAARYDTEARLNQSIANIYELQVRKSNASAERHHRRSRKIFYGMLAAQMAVIIATFSIAARQKSLLWSLAATAGLVAWATPLTEWLGRHATRLPAVLRESLGISLAAHKGPPTEEGALWAGGRWMKVLPFSTLNLFQLLI